MVKKLVLAVLLLAVPSAAPAHPAPFSYLDLRIGTDVIEGTLVVHIIDAAHDLGIDPPEKLLDRSVAYGNLDRLTALLTQRMVLRADRPLTIQWGDVDMIPERQGLQLHFHIHTPRPATLDNRTFVATIKYCGIRPPVTRRRCGSSHWSSSLVRVWHNH